MSAPVRRTLLFTDVVDSTQWVERLGDAGALERWAAHDHAARALLARHGGREIDRSDGFFLLFEQADAAARFAQDYHAALATLEMQARAAIHVGAVTLRANAPDEVARGAKAIEVEGLAKPMAARLMALAPGGRTLLSAAAAQALDGLDRHASHGHYRLKGLAEPAELFELLPAAGNPDAPPADTEKAYRVVRDGDLWRPVREVRSNLPAERDAFVGRAAELRTLAARLSAGVRLVTIAGTGGTGKTRLARRYGRAWLGDWPGGVWFCDLSEARSAEGVCFAVAAALGVPVTGDNSVQRLGHAIAARGRCLVILDNFEQVAAHAAATLGAWLDAAPDAAFVVTSRERLHLPGETVLAIEPLDLAGDASTLFEVRAQAQRPEFALNPANRQAVAEVVRLLDGLPLAIELAAARIRVLSPAQIVERLRDRFVLLAGARGTAQRQATLRAAIDWSWQLLAPWEQATLAQCSVFEGGFTLEAAEAVVDLSAWPEAGPALDVVQALVDKSLLRTWMPPDEARLDIAEPYFGMYLSIREFAAQRLAEAGEAARLAAQLRHGRHYALAGQDDAIDALSRPGGVSRMRSLALDVDNLVAALRRAAHRGDGAVAAACLRALGEVLHWRGPSALAVELGLVVAVMPGLPSILAARACLVMARAVLRSGNVDRVRALLDEASAHARDAGNARFDGEVLHLTALATAGSGELEAAATLHRQAIAHATAHGDRVMEGVGLVSLGNALNSMGRPREAIDAYEQALAVHRECGNRREEGIALGNLALALMDTGRGAEARVRLEAAIEVDREVGSRSSEGTNLSNLATMHELDGRLEEAKHWNEAALAIQCEVGNRRVEGVILGSLARIAQAQGLGAEARSRYEAALEVHRAVGDQRSQAWTQANFGGMLSDLGSHAEGLELLRHAEALMRANRDRFGLSGLFALRGWAELQLGDEAAARASLAQADAAEQEFKPDPSVATANARLRRALGKARRGSPPG